MHCKHVLPINSVAVVQLCAVEEGEWVYSAGYDGAATARLTQCRKKRRCFRAKLLSYRSHLPNGHHPKADA